MVPFNHVIQIIKPNFQTCLSQTTLALKSNYQAIVSQGTRHPEPTCPTAHTNSSDHGHMRSRDGNDMLEEACLENFF